MGGNLGTVVSNKANHTAPAGRDSTDPPVRPIIPMRVLGRNRKSCCVEAAKNLVRETKHTDR